MSEVNVFEAMVRLQNTTQDIFNPEWLDLDWNFLRAARIEGSEAITHLGYSWWKKPSDNYTEAAIEIVDAFIFVVCDIIRSNSKDSNVEDYVGRTATSVSNRLRIGLEAGFNECMYEGYVENRIDIINSTIETFIEQTRINPLKSLETLGIIISMLGLNADGFFKRYIGKNALNIFRKKNGYKNGTYEKFWEKEEDNVWLNRIMDGLSVTNPMTFQKTVTLELEDYYKRLVPYKVTGKIYL